MTSVQPMTGADGFDAVLGPATRLLWRTHNAIHLELGGRAVVVERLPQPVISRLVSSAPAVPGRSPAMADDVAEALRDLVTDGYLWRRAGTADDLRLRPPAPRLSGELLALATRYGEQAADLLDRRARATVSVRGHPRLAVHVAALLAASGVGRVSGPGSGTARLLHAVPGGLLPRDEGRELMSAAHEAVARSAPETNVTPPPASERPDLVLLALDGPIDDDRRAALHADGCAHLAMTIAPHGGAVGPLVIPGMTSCLRCADLHRRDRDPSWPALAAQLSVPRRFDCAGDVASESVVAGTAVAQALAFLDGEVAGCVDATLEFALPDWRIRRRTWPAHRQCDCGAGDFGSVAGVRQGDGDHWAD